MREKLTAAGVAKLTKPGRFADGGGLYIFVKPDGRKTWTFRWRDRVTQKLREKGLGPYGRHDVSLADARVLAGECRRQVREGKDPIAEARQRRQEAILAHQNHITFGTCLTRYVDAHKAAWRNAKHTAQWSNTLNTHAAQLIPLPVSEINDELVLQCLEPIWTTKTETASRVRQRIESVLDWATARKYRTGENPARWRGHLDKLLPKPSSVRKIKHRPALNYQDAGEFIVKLREVDSMAAHALELQILTATRPGETVGARWDEFDLDNKVWTIPGERMKANKEHTIPLSPQSIALLKRLPKASEFVFPGKSLKKNMTTAAGMKLLKRIEPGITAHGFRSTFRDWAADNTSYPREVCEAALAHQLKDKAEAAYFRSDLIAKRSRLMDDWANYCDTKLDQADNVTPIRKKAES